MKKTKRLIVAKRGTQYITLKIQEIAFFTTADKLTYAVDPQGKRYLIPQKLSELEEEMDSSVFFRINRQYLVNVFFIKSFRPYKKVQLILELDMDNLKDEMVVSQLSTPAFREWINNL